MTTTLRWLNHVSPAEEKVGSGFEPGGWRDRLLFGFMFRVVSAVVACLVPIGLLLVWGAINGWVLTQTMLSVFVVITSVLIVVGEWLRSSVYDTRVRKARRAKFRDTGKLDDALAATILVYGEPAFSYRAAKRVFDALVSSFLLTGLTPLLIMLPILIRLDSPGPVLFASRRIGFKGQVFRLYKFRTMHLYSEDSGRPEDQRITRVGAFLRRSSFDELPQLFNVLLGDLSLVGPRPSLAFADDPRDKTLDKSTDALSILYYAKPGITGLHLPGSDADVRLIGYLEKRSFLFDLKILLRTFSYILRRNAY